VTGSPEAVQAALTLEERAKQIMQAALDDEAFMRDVREAQQLDLTGDKGEPWSQVKARLGLV
jgi:hypothetical protein